MNQATCLTEDRRINIRTGRLITVVMDSSHGFNKLTGKTDGFFQMTEPDVCVAAVKSQLTFDRVQTAEHRETKQVCSV